MDGTASQKYPEFWQLGRIAREVYWLREIKGKWGMFKHCVAATLALSLGFVAQTAHAFFDPPWITPEAPRAGEIVSVNIRGGICDSIF